MVSLKKFEDLRAMIELEKQMLEARLTKLREALQETEEANGEEPAVRKISVQEQQRLDYLMDKNNEGLLSPAEKRELAQLADSAQRLSISNAKSLLGATRQTLAGLNGTNGARSHNVSSNAVRTRLPRRVSHA